ncbi:MAG: phosphotransferase [Lapillicoccus sp.]
MTAGGVRAAFGLPPGTLTADPVARGLQGVVHRFDADDGSRWAVKIALSPPAGPEVAFSAAFEEAAASAGIPAPGVRRTVDGQVLATIAGHTVRVAPWVDLQGPDIGLDPASVGQLLARLHAVPERASFSSKGIGVHSWYCQPVGGVAWDAHIRRCRRLGAPFAERLSGHRDVLVDLERLLAPPDRLQTCHRDLFADNVRGTAAGGVCVVDFDNAGPAAPSQELAFVLVEFGTDASGVVDAARCHSLLEAYAAAGGPGRLTGPGAFSMVIAVLGHLVELGVEHWCDATEDPAIASADLAGPQAMVLGVLDRPFTLDVVHGLLSA